MSACEWDNDTTIAVHIFGSSTGLLGGCEAARGQAPNISITRPIKESREAILGHGSDLFRLCEPAKPLGNAALAKHVDYGRGQTQSQMRLKIYMDTYAYLCATPQRSPWATLAPFLSLLRTIKPPRLIRLPYEEVPTSGQPDITRVRRRISACICSCGSENTDRARLMKQGGTRLGALVDGVVEEKNCSLTSHGDDEGDDVVNIGDHERVTIMLGRSSSQVAQGSRVILVGHLKKTRRKILFLFFFSLLSWVPPLWSPCLLGSV